MKKLFFSLILALITYLFVEVAAYAAYRIKFGEYNLEQLQLSKQDGLSEDVNRGVFEPAAALSKSKEVSPILHPYLGFTVDGKIRDNNCVSTEQIDCYQRIKVASDRTLEKRGPNKLNVAILGGSFADGTARGGTPGYYAHMLKGIPEFEEKNITVYNLASGAYKQPQQLMYINYFYALGAEFDIIINIDGFNEVTSTYYGWRDNGLHPAFPASWDKRVSSGIDQQDIAFYVDKTSLDNRHKSSANFFLAKGIRLSPLMNFLWEISNANYIRKKNKLMESSATIEGHSRDFAYESLGPDFDLPDVDAFSGYAVELWANSSRAIRALAEGYGASYYHFLQPNQYIDGAKILSEFERNHAILTQGGYGNVYKSNYPKLAEKGEQLVQEGVNFYDLTFMFKDNPDDLYIDNCCHLSPKGYDIVVREVLRKIAKHRTSNESNTPTK